MLRMAHSKTNVENNFPLQPAEALILFFFLFFFLTRGYIQTNPSNYCNSSEENTPSSLIELRFMISLLFKILIFLFFHE